MAKYQKYLDASNKAMDFFVRNIAEDGEFKGKGTVGDLGAIYKAPTLLLLAGRVDVATRLLEYIQRRYGQNNGDFLSYPDKTGREKRTVNGLLKEFQAYMGGWITAAAQRIGRFDISMPSYDFLQTFWSPKAKTFIVNEPYNESSQEQIVDTLISSHLGLLALFFRDMDKATGAGDAIVKIYELQNDLENRFIFRMWASSGELITDKATCPAADGVCFLKRNGKDELFFMLGFPVIFLSKLYLATKVTKYLETAKKFLDFALTCDDSLYTFYLSHKVAYGASLVARITKESRYVTLAEKIADYLVSAQDANGVFDANRMPVPDDQYDQVGEIGTWLREIYTELNGV